jgi:hypothetical protein
MVLANQAMGLKIGDIVVNGKVYVADVINIKSPTYGFKKNVQQMTKIEVNGTV